MALTPQNVQKAIFDHIGFDYERTQWPSRPDWFGIESEFKQSQAVIIDDDPYIVQVVDSEFAGEGDYNAAVYVVFQVRNAYEDKAFRIAGWYQSYEGTDWDTNLYEVKPREVKVTKWDLV